MSDFIQNGNLLKWTIRNFKNIDGDIESVYFTLDGYEDFTWYLHYRFTGDDFHIINSSNKLRAYRFYLFRDREDGCQWEARVSYRVQVPDLSLDVTVFNFYPKEKEDALNYLYPARCVGSIDYRPQQDLLVIVTIKQVDIVKTGWPNEIMPNVAASMTKFMAEGNFADVTIVVGNEQFKAHKMLLAAHSSVFESMFTQEMVEKQTNRVVIDDISADVFKAFLKYIYLGSFSEITEHCDQLIQLANKYQVEMLKNDCEEHLIRSIKLDNCLELLKIGDLFGSKKLVDAAIEFIKKYRSEWEKIEAFNDFFLKQPHLMLTLMLVSSKK